MEMRREGRSDATIKCDHNGERSICLRDLEKERRITIIERMNQQKPDLHDKE